jgi:copper chaperone
MCSTTGTTNDLGLTDKNAACACGSTRGDEHGEVSSAGSLQSVYLVSGMTCSHCVSSVTEELSALDGVDGVTVELNPGGASRVTVASSTELDGGAVRAAVEEAGYELADSVR